ncbi:Putative acetyltransferase EpsM [Aquisphaera giovannonii]|uniref:Acetyltransferase EpsM n=1 Tax=Aquisphaera giovannonii TaxID=406548 RepID=A0A5B9WD32_9BACT|nr:NeuD/PglB/VioB family sugar acetyltransferase [Aquisphaera giovannonii]QEH37851.1 Putative acetyltransferase EpsM [Aquisphaera giovannonii]
MRRLVILGTGGSAYDVLDVVDAINAILPTWQPVGFLDDSRPAGARHLGLDVLGPLREARGLTGCFLVSAIGGEKSFRDLPRIIGSTGVGPDRFATLIHPAASVSPRARLGRGVLVNPGVVIAGDVSIGDHVLLCPGCVIGHEAQVGDHVILAPGAIVSGLVRVESACYIGAGAVIKQKLHVGAGSLIGMGSVVTREVECGATLVGNPARPLKREG